MANVVDFLVGWAAAIWAMLVDSAFLFLIGIALAGLVRVALNEKTINRLLGGGKASAVFKAALFGVPLPLCSCSVLPVAYQLRQSGLSKGGTAAFLISTPESGLDSIMLTYSLMDPLLTVARPVTAFLSAAVAGLTETLFEKEQQSVLTKHPESPEACCHPAVRTGDGLLTSAKKTWAGLKYAFTDLFADLAPYLLIGYLLASLAAAVFTADLYRLPETLQSGWGGYVGAVIIGLPLYVCATSSTPLAAALLAAGFSPGAMLVFMMVGPATNLASLVVVGKLLRGWGTVRYLLTIVSVAIIAGIVTDYLYDYFRLADQFGTARDMAGAAWTNQVAAVILALLIVYRSARKMVGRI